ncbi:MAG: hypothetical protein PUQ00_06915 [Nostoc sp. S13]|nr:hypothetical protein [Nostoc sp. S13]
MVINGKPALSRRSAGFGYWSLVLIIFQPSWVVSFPGVPMCSSYDSGIVAITHGYVQQKTRTLS